MMAEKKIKNNMSSSGLTRRSRNKDLHADWMPDQVGHDRKEEQGRSMTEMLGVLAIIGVLSVGSIAGFRYGMDKYYANEIIDGVSMMAVTASQGLMLNGDFSLSEYGDKVAGYAYTTNKDFGGTDDRFSITVQGIEDGVCEQVKNMDWSMPYQILVNEAENGNCVDPSNIEFVFYDGLGGDENSDGENGNNTGCGVGQKSCGTSCCPKNASCRDGQCIGYGLVCAVGESMICPVLGICKCVPEGETGACGHYMCQVCEANETPICTKEDPEEPFCECVPEGKTGECSDMSCITCNAGEKAICPQFATNTDVDLEDGVESCQCVPENTPTACGARTCITCEANETAVCPFYDTPEWEEGYEPVNPNDLPTSCRCVPADKKGYCNDDFCIICDKNEIPAESCKWAMDESECQCVPASETTVCAGKMNCITCGEGYTGTCDVEGGCQCIPEGKTGACGYNCIICEADETPMCSDWGDWDNNIAPCVCIPKNEAGGCNRDECITCSNNQIAHCPFAFGECICAPEDVIVACGYSECNICEDGEVPSCDDYYQECICCPEGKSIASGWEHGSEDDWICI